MSGDTRSASERLVHFNLIMTVVWVMLLVPTLVWWRDSILWVLVVSLYANAAAHWSAYQGSRASVKVEQKDDPDKGSSQAAQAAL
jgi:hypothetical protein